MSRSIALTTALSIALGLAACGGGGPDALPASAGGAGPVLQASFGGDAPAAAITAIPVTIRVFNYSNANILDMGIRPFGETTAWQGSLLGQDPTTYGKGAGGGIDWVTVPVGGYEVFIETDLGRIDTVGWIQTVTLPSGQVIPAPTDVYLWGLDFDPPTGGGAGGTTGGGGSGSGGILP